MKTQSFIKQKFVFLLSTALLVIFSTVHAQQQQTSQESALATKFGIKGGLNLTNLSSDNFTDNHLKPGFNVGIFSKIPVTPGFSVQPELLYSLKGSKTDYNNFVEGTGQYRFNLGYVELPVLAVVNLAKNFSIHLGGYGAYLTNANVKDVNNNGTIQSITELNANDFNRWDFGLAGGLAFDIENFTLGARYNYGLTEIGKSGNLTGTALGNAKNNGLSIYVGFGF
ncbi:MAG TPA: porin family protein [Puia sp.]|nr:porin family protein [Puia sp.]